MTTAITSDGITQESDNYRGALVYRQEYGYKLITITISVAPNEQSYVTSLAHNLLLAEEAEHLPGINLYHFAVTDGTLLQLAIETPAGSSEEAWYTIAPDEIIVHCSPFRLYIMRSEESVPFVSVYAQEALDETLTCYADQIPDCWTRCPGRVGKNRREP
ncbi:MAG TPA: hypothetical protein VH593_01620 [Ktedonobacteraceae bacterium]|jgi:hypothetical protein